MLKDYDHCTFCHAREHFKDLTPMYEPNKPGFIRVYCDKCIKEVKHGMKSHEWAYLKFGKRGELADDNH